MIDAERLKDEFLDLVCISSLSRREGAIARRLEVILKGMGATVETDDAGERVGGETGNLLARFPGTAPEALPFLLSSHMDTVGPAAAIRPLVEGDVVRTDGTSVLGGDDKAGIVAIFEAIRVLRERGIPHGDIEVVLTICEESGLAGLQVDADPLHLSTHAVEFCGSGSADHLDVRFLAVLGADTEPQASEESLEVRWWPVDELPTDEPDMVEMIELGLRR